jgi:hypothetical protein
MTTLDTIPSTLALDGLLVAKQKSQGAQLAFAVAIMERLAASSALSTEAQTREQVIRERAADIMWRQACLSPQLRLGSRLPRDKPGDIPTSGAQWAQWDQVPDSPIFAEGQVGMIWSIDNDEITIDVDEELDLELDLELIIEVLL